MKPAIKPWSPDEEAILRETYPRGHRAAAAALPHRSLNAIFHRAQKLELYTHRPWTRRDDAQLVDYWNEGFLGLATIAKKLGRTVGATYERSKVLGLPAGVPPGFETMSSAAARTGYNTTQLRMVLGWASVRVHRGLSRPTGKKKRSHYVSPEDVDDAVGEWLKTEPIESAARRHGLCGETLAKWLRDAGVEWRIMRGTRRHRRVRSVDVDRVVAERGLFSSLKENAKRLGIGRETLAKWLLAAGFSPTGGHFWLLRDADVDRVAREKLTSCWYANRKEMKRAARILSCEETTGTATAPKVRNDRDSMFEDAA